MTGLKHRCVSCKERLYVNPNRQERMLTRLTDDSFDDMYTTIECSNCSASNVMLWTFTGHVIGNNGELET